MSDNSVEIQVCLEIINSELGKLTNYSIVNIAKELYNNSAHLTDYDIVGGQLMIEMVVNAKNDKESEVNDSKKRHTDNNESVRKA